MTRPIRVVVLGHTAACGGAELALQRMLTGVADDLFEVQIILFAHGSLVGRLAEAGHHVRVVKLRDSLAGADRNSVGGSSLSLARTFLAVVPFVLRLGTDVLRLRPDVIYATTLKSDLMSIPVSWLARRPLVWHIHDRISPDYLPDRMVRLLRFLARHAPQHVIVNSEATALTLPGVRNLSVAYPGFSGDQVGAAPADRMGPTAPVIGILGRVSPTKGQLEFVRAASLVLQRHPEARFRVIGAPLFSETEYADDVHREVAALGIEDRVEFTGFTSDPAGAIDGLTVCVHASPTPEPFGQVIVEAMIRGVPVIATRGGGVTEIVQPDPSADPFGWLVEPRDVAGLAAAITEALDRPELARRRAEAAWASAQERFSVSDTARIIGGVWRSVAQSR